MAKKIAGALFLLVTTSSIFAIAIAKTTKPIAKTTNCTGRNGSYHNGSGSWGWSWSSCSGGKNNGTQPVSNTINVNWTTGIDYQYWATMKAPFSVNDTLVFHYPNDANKYTVYLMSDPGSYYICRFNRNAKLIADTTAGAGAGFSFVLKAKPYWLDQNYYFACKNHCQLGMKLSVFPMMRY